MRFHRTMLAALAASAAHLPAAPALAQAAGEESAVPDRSCERDCLIGLLRDHMAALAAKDPSKAPFAADVMFTENNVPIKIGQGLWKTVTAVDQVGLELADKVTGNAAWFGSVKENGAPAIYAVRIHVKDGKIDEVESVVHRKTALPAPFGDVSKMVHDPEFSEILPPEQRRSRERMLAIADSYFDTVEVNDGQVFAPFSDDCGRLENGISTTAPTPGDPGGNAAALASGCRAQFELGIYRINKRVRRDFFIVDEERGVVVGRGFFDHANEWDRYLLTNGREMKTALKWPNTITLLEAFRIKNAEIQRIEAVFTYVPYFKNNPFWRPDSKMPAYAPKPSECDDACVDQTTRQVVGSFAGNKWHDVNWAPKVGYAENSVGIRVGEGIWAGVTIVDANPLVIADAKAGKGVWIGRIEEHGQPAWGTFTVAYDGKKVGSIDVLIRRKEYGPPYAEPNGGPAFAELAPAERISAKAMRAATESFYKAMNTKGAKAPAGISAECRWAVNGQDVGDCASPFGGPVLSSLEQVRDREVLAVDEKRGLIVYRTFEDFPAVGGAAGTYPHSFQVVELFRFRNGKIERVEAFNSELPYGMKPRQ